MTMARRRLLDDSFKKSVVGNPAIATDSLARMYPGITMQGWTTQDGTPTPETPVPIVSAGTQNQETGKWEYEVELSCGNLINELDAIYNEKFFTYENGKFTCVNGASTYVWFEKVLPVGDYLWSVNCDEIEGSGKIEVRSNNEILYRSTFSDPGRKNLIFTSEGNTTLRLLFGDNAESAITFSKPMLNIGSAPIPWEPYRPPQTVTLTADRPLTKWDKLTKKNGVWGWVYKSAEIESYTDESVPGEYYSTTGQLSAGAQVWYETNTETFVPLAATDQEAMNALYTYRPTTVLSNQQNCQMTLTYKTRKGMGGG